MKSPLILVPPRWRRAACSVALLGVLVSGFGLFSEVSQALPPGTPAAGTVSMVPSTGDSDTVFSLQFGTPAAPQMCPGDNTESYLWHTFITPASNDPAAMTYTPSGTPTGAPAFTNNLANSIGTRTRNILPGLGDGNIIQPTLLTFTHELYGAATPGDYWIGIACTLPDNTNGTVTTEKFWASRITVTASTGSGSNNFTYAPSTVVDQTTTTTVADTTTTTTTTTVSGSTTTSTVAGSTTTSTVSGSTTTSTVAGSTTTVASSGASTTTIRVASSGSGQSGGGGGSVGQTLASTGPSFSTPMTILWSVLLVIFGRMAILLARPIRVITDPS